MIFLTDIMPQFYETKEFPKELCTVQNKDDECVLDSTQKFECVLYSKKWNSIEIKELFPYIWVNHRPDEVFTEAVYPGWVDKDTNVYDHCELSLQGDPTVVVGWRIIQ